MKKSSRIETRSRGIRLNEEYEENKDRQILSARDINGWLGYVGIEEGKPMINGEEKKDKEKDIRQAIQDFKDLSDRVGESKENEDKLAEEFNKLFDRLMAMIGQGGLFDEIDSQKGFFDEIEEKEGEQHGFFNTL